MTDYNFKGPLAEEQAEKRVLRALHRVPLSITPLRSAPWSTTISKQKENGPTCRDKPEVQEVSNKSIKP